LRRCFADIDELLANFTPAFVTPQRKLKPLQAGVKRVNEENTRASIAAVAGT